MKHIHTLIKTAAAMAIAGLLSTGAMAQDGQEVSDKKLEAFASAAIEITAVVKELRPQMQAATDQEQRDKIAAKGDKRIAMIIEAQENITSEEYDAIAAAIQNDQELRNRLNAIVAQQLNGDEGGESGGQ